MNNNQNMNQMNNQPMPGMGQPVNNAPNQMMPGQTSPKKVNPLLIAIPVIVVIVAVVVFIFLGGDNYKEPIEAYCKGMNDLDFETIKKAVPKEYLQDLEGDDNTEEYFDTMKESLEEYDMTFSVKCKIGEGTEVSKEELDELNEDFKDSYETDRKISKAYKVEVERETKSTYQDEEEVDSETVKMIVGKIDGKWYYLDEE